jgi:hypothetical protein
MTWSRSMEPILHKLLTAGNRLCHAAQSAAPQAGKPEKPHSLNASRLDYVRNGADPPPLSSGGSDSEPNRLAAVRRRRLKPAPSPKPSQKASKYISHLATHPIHIT